MAKPKDKDVIHIDGYMPKVQVYLANAYSPVGIKDSADKELLKKKRRYLEAFIGGHLIKKYGVAPILPIATSAAMSEIHKFDTGFKQWEEIDFTYIFNSDEVWVLMSSGWDKSVGVKAEIAFAEKFNIKVRYLNPISLNLFDTPEEAKNAIHT